MGMPSGMELVIIVAVILLLFGGKKIPELAKGLGSGIKNFKNALNEDEVASATPTATTSQTQSNQVNATVVEATSQKKEEVSTTSKA
jgi:sec-independent protein translocase protein TatA